MLNLGAGEDTIAFLGAKASTVTGSSGTAAVTADGGTNRFIAGSGILEVTGGPGADGYIYHASSGLLTIRDFSFAKGDTLTIDAGLRGAMTQVSDGHGGVMLRFGTDGHGIDLVGVKSIDAAQIRFT